MEDLEPKMVKKITTVDVKGAENVNMLKKDVTQFENPFPEDDDDEDFGDSSDSDGSSDSSDSDDADEEELMKEYQRIKKEREQEKRLEAEEKAKMLYENSKEDILAKNPLHRGQNG